jgi:hypothetical protein
MAAENERELQQMDRDTVNLYRRHMANSDLRNTDTVLEKRKKERGHAKASKGKPTKRPNRPLDQSYVFSPARGLVSVGE